MLNDSGADTYTTDRLQDLILASAYFLIAEINFNTTYVVTVSVTVTSDNVTPDPLLQVDGYEFISLVVLKAACMLDESSFRTAALLQGVKARCGPAVIETNKYGDQLKTLLTQGPCAAFDQLKKQYNFSYEGKKIVRAIMSPFVSNEFFTF
jgi:hypothetical protein